MSNRPVRYGPPRRGVLGAIGWAAVAAAGIARPGEAAAGKPDPEADADADAELLRLVERLKQNDAAILAVWAWGDQFDEPPLELDERLKVIDDESRVLEGKIGSTRAYGLAGLRAKASVAWGLKLKQAYPNPNHQPQPQPHGQDFIFWSLARDLGAENAAVSSDAIRSAEV